MMIQAALSQYFFNDRREIEPLLPAAIHRVLELGCGSGQTMRWIRQLRPVGYAVAIELFEDAANMARSVFDHVVVGDAMAGLASLDGPEFDLVLALDVLEHLADPAETVRRLRERIAPGGRLVLSLPNVGHYTVCMPLLFRGRWDYQDEGLLDRTHLRFFSECTARALLEQNGFVVERMAYVYSFPNLLSIVGIKGRHGRWYTQRLLGWGPFSASHLFKFQFLIDARRG
jgi:SAM-dependent methyltransferase